MGKAGSSSIQAWLARNRERLGESGVCLLAAHLDRDAVPPSELHLRPYESGPLNANAVVRAWETTGDDKSRLLDSLFETLESSAEGNRITVISAEAMAVFFTLVFRDFLDRLEDLGRRHPVRVAFYVRPQHTSLEAGWRQWGFRTEYSPAAYVERLTRNHHYLETLSTMRELIPSVSFEVRPFRPDLLDAGDPAVDFAGRFLGETDVDPGEGEEIWANRGLPLEVVNALRLAEPGRFWSSQHDNRKLDRLKRFIPEFESPEGDRVRRSRELLARYAHATFEPSNARLIEELGWSTDAFVPAPAEPYAGNLAELDELWLPRASPRELEALFALVDEVLAPPPPPDPAMVRELRASRSTAKALSRDLDRAEAELARLRAARSWKLSRRLAAGRARVSGARNGAEPPPDPTERVSRHLRRAAKRIDELRAKAPSDRGGAGERRET